MGKARRLARLFLLCFVGLEEADMTQPEYLSREELERRKATLERLRTEGRRAVAEQLQESKERGGTVNNAEYEDAKNKMAETEGQIRTLEIMINTAVIIDDSHDAASGVVEVGSTVTVENQDGRSLQYTITGSAEADPSQGKISNVSPIGKGLLGRKVGDVTEVNIPSGKIRFQIVSIA